MRQVRAGAWGSPYRIGLRFGVLAGLVGVIQWGLTARDLEERLAQAQAVWRRFPGHYRDGTNIARGNEWFWFCTAPVVVGAMVAACGLAAFLAGRFSRNPRDGVVAGWIAAVVGGGTYIVATAAAIATSSEPSITQTLEPCAVVVGIGFVCGLAFVVPAAADMGAGANRNLRRRVSRP